jgi:hypothetical protein
MPRRRLSIAMPGDAPAKAPEHRSHEPRRKNAAAAKNTAKSTGNLARKRTRSKAKPLGPAAAPLRLLLAAPPRVLLLTYAGQAQQIRSGGTTIHLPHVVTAPSVPRRTAAIQRDVQASSSAQASSYARSTARPNAATPQQVTPTSPGVVAAAWYRTYSVDPRAAAKIGITGAVIGAVLLLARLTPVKPNDATLKHAAPPAQTALVRDIGERAGAAVNAAAEPPKLVHHPNVAPWMRTKWTRRGVAHVRIIDAPARMKQSCGEQTWPYIADYCLTVAEQNVKNSATPAYASSVAAAAVDAVDAGAPHAAMAAATIDTPPALTLDAGHATAGPEIRDGVSGRASYRTAAISDDAVV